MTISSKMFKFLTATIIINQKLRKVNRISKKSGSTKIRYNTAVSRNYKQKINRRKEVKIDMTNVQKIKKLYFDNHLKQNEIAKKLGISSQRVSKILINDSRYSKEKLFRTNQNKLKRKEYLKNFWNKYYESKKEESANDKAELDYLHRQASNELSKPKHNISNRQMVYSNISAYKRKNGNLILDESINPSYAMPKKFIRKVK